MFVRIRRNDSAFRELNLGDVRCILHLVLIPLYSTATLTAREAGTREKRLLLAGRTELGRYLLSFLHCPLHGQPKAIQRGTGAVCSMCLDGTAPQRCTVLDSMLNAAVLPFSLHWHCRAEVNQPAPRQGKAKEKPRKSQGNAKLV